MSRPVIVPPDAPVRAFCGNCKNHHVGPNAVRQCYIHDGHADLAPPREYEPPEDSGEILNEHQKATIESLASELASRGFSFELEQAVIGVLGEDKEIDEITESQAAALIIALTDLYKEKIEGNTWPPIGDIRIPPKKLEEFKAEWASDLTASTSVPPPVFVPPAPSASSGTHTTVTVPVPTITPKQVELVRTLLDALVSRGHVEDVNEILRPLIRGNGGFGWEYFSKGDASTLIDGLIGLKIKHKLPYTPMSPSTPSSPSSPASPPVTWDGKGYEPAPEPANDEPVYRPGTASFDETVLHIGRYAYFDSEGDLKFVHVREDKWHPLWRRILRQSSDNLYPVTGRYERQRIIEAILEQGWERCMKLYGSEIGQCGHCGRKLTSEWRHRGIGPVCIQKMGWE